jgi:hypothetical protein
MTNTENLEKNQNNVLSIQEEKDKRTIFRIQKTKDDPYIRINKGCLQDSRLSWKAKGLLAYMLSLPDDWVFHRDELLKHSPDGRKSLLSTIKELKEAGYLKVVPEKNDNGRVVRWNTHVFEFPQIPLKNVQNTQKGILDKNQNPLFENVEKPECGKGTTTNKTRLKTNKLKNNKQSHDYTQAKPEPQKSSHQADPSVVVDLMEKLKEWLVAKTILRTWLKKHSVEYILEKIEYTKAYATKNPAGLLRRAIENNYKLHLSKETNLYSPPSETVWPSHEENVAWYNGLSQEQKIECLNAGVSRHPYFEGHLKHAKVSVLDANFTENSFFKMLMQLVGRAQ